MDILNILSDYQLSEGRYNARDVLATLRIYKPLVEAITATDTLRVYQHDREMAKLALQMRRIGMPIDNDERIRVGEHLKQIRDASIAALRPYADSPEFVEWICNYQAATVRKGDPQMGQATLFGTSESAESAFAARVALRKQTLERVWAKKRSKGIDPFNINSKIQSAALLRVAGVNLTRLSQKTGIPKLDKDTLQAHLSNPAARAMHDYGITAGIIETFVDGLQVDSNGFLHPDWLIHKITGRWGSHPNVQNWSKRAGGGAENLRRMVRAPNGYVLVGADFAQLEARILACLSRDPLLLEIFAGKRDIHAEMAVVGYPTIWPGLDKIYKIHNVDGVACKCDSCLQRGKLRDMVKRLEYGAFYGGDPKTLHAAVVKDVPTLMLRDVETFVRAINSKMPNLLRWRQSVLNDVLRTKEVRSPFLGRRQVFPLGRVDPGVAYNYKAQSGGADLWAMGAIEFVKRYPQSDVVRIIHNGHDSVLIMCPQAETLHVCNAVRESWERTVDGVPFKLDVKTGERWSEV